MRVSTHRMKFPEFFFAHQSALFGIFLTINLSARCNTNTPGNIQVLEKCPNLTSVNFEYCENIEGEHTSNEIS